MAAPFSTVWIKVARASMMSTVALAGTVCAHEVQPTIGDITLAEDRRAVLALSLNAEAFLAGIDLDAIENTDATQKAAEYDAFRAMAPEDLAARLDALVVAWEAAGLVKAGGAPLDLQVVAQEVVPERDFELPRETRITLEVMLPADSDAVVIDWPAGSGALILRQQGTDSAYTGYLLGGQASPEIR